MPAPCVLARSKIFAQDCRSDRCPHSDLTAPCLQTILASQGGFVRRRLAGFRESFKGAGRVLRIAFIALGLGGAILTASVYAAIRYANLPWEVLVVGDPTPHCCAWEDWFPLLPRELGFTGVLGFATIVILYLIMTTSKRQAKIPDYGDFTDRYRWRSRDRLIRLGSPMSLNLFGVIFLLLAISLIIAIALVVIRTLMYSTANDQILIQWPPTQMAESTSYSGFHQR